MKNEVSQAVNGQGSNQNCQDQIKARTQQHPYAFNVSGPRNVPSINWRDLINSTWKNGNYKRTVIACFIQAVYLLEIDRQENRTNDDALAPKWWIPFKFRLVEILIDDRDASIFGAIFEWDRTAALQDFVLIRPSGAPRVVLALRGTLLKSPTIRRDVEDDLRFLGWESLKGSVRFNCSLQALRLVCSKYGSNNVCIAGHSLGAGFALQVGKALAQEGIYVEAHLFNPPSVSVASGLRTVGEKAGIMWRKVRAMLPSNGGDAAVETHVISGSNKQWMPNLYVNNSDYICCYYSDGGGEENAKAVASTAASAAAAAKLFVLSKGKQKFLEAHGLEQWWSDDLEVQMAVHNSKLISRQLKSLYSLAPSEQSPTGKVR